MKTIKNFWEERSKIYGDKLEGVLFKSLPREINNYIHEWMLKEIRRMVPSGKETNISAETKILDIGCGYGRLSKPLTKQYSKTKLFGIDISKTYVDLYNKNLSPRGKAFVADARELPFKRDFFDVVFVVTTIMYLNHSKDQQKAISEIFRVLKPGGHFVIIERNPVGYELVTLFGLMEKLRSKQKEIPAVSFSSKEITCLVNKEGGIVMYKRGIPLFTLFLYPLLIISLLNKNFLKILLKLIKLLDNRLNWLLTISLYISYSGSKIK